MDNGGLKQGRWYEQRARQVGWKSGEKVEDRQG